MDETAAQLDVAALDRAAAALVRARFIDFFAVSGSAGITLDLQLRLHAAGHPCALWTDVHNALSSANARDHRDVAVAVSHSGTTAEVVEPLAVARDRGATTIAITNFPLSRLVGTADIVLTTAARETSLRSGATASRIAALTVVDCLYITVAHRDLDRATKAVAETRAAVAGHHV